MKKLISALSSLCLAATSLLGAFAAVPMTASAAEVKADGDIVYDLIPKGKTYTAATGSGNNQYTAEPGETFTIQWTVKNDQKVSGLQMFLDFSDLTGNGGKYIGSEMGDAYELIPTINEKNANISKAENAKDGGQVFYGFGGNEVYQADDNAVLYEFEVQAPEKEGNYSIVRDTRDKCKVIPLVGNEYSYTMHGLTVKVGNAPEVTTTAKQNDPAQTTTVKQQDPGDPIPTGSIIYDLIPKGKEYTAAPANQTGNNVYQAAAGEELTVQWTVKNDKKVSGLQMFLDFSDVTGNGGKYIGSEMGDAYELMPTINEKNANVSKADNAKDGGQVFYGFGGNDEFQAADGAVVYEFNIQVPEKDGSYVIVRDTRDKCKVVPLVGDEYSYALHGLEIQVGDAPAKVTTTKAQETVSGDSIVYNLIPKGKDYDGVADNVTGNNVYMAAPGEKITIQWTVKNDKDVSGLQMFFDFSGVTDNGGKYNGSDMGDAYELIPTINEKFANESKATNARDGGQVFYGFGGNEEYKASNNAVIYEFTVTAPEKDGTYSVVQDTRDKCKVIPLVGDAYSFVMHGIDIVVGEAPIDETTTTKQQTVSTDSIIYNLIPKGKEYEKAADNFVGNNGYTATPGEEITVQWTVKNDKKVSGLQMFFDFSDVTENGGKYNGSDMGDAYELIPTINEKYVNTSKAENAKDGGQVFYGFGGNEEYQADNNAVIYEFTINAPEKEGKYVIVQDGRDKCKVIPLVGDAYDFVMHGLEITVADAKTTTTAAENIPAGKTSWTIAKVTAAAGADVKVPVTVEGDEGTGGFVAEFKCDDALTIKGVEWGTGYTGEATINNNELVVVWADEDGADQKANGEIMNILVTAPNAAGEYPVTFKSLEVVNTSGNELTVTKKDGAVIVEGEAGSANWIIGEDTVLPGAEATVPVTVKGDTGTSGFVVEFEYDPALTFTGIEWADGYTGEPTKNEESTDEKAVLVVWAEENGKDIKAADGAVVMNLKFTAPSAAGEYPVTFKSLEVTDTNGVDLNLTKENGKVIVNGVTTTAEPGGNAGWVIGKETVAKGATAKVPVTVTGDPGTAGFVVEFEADPALTFTGFEWGTGYTGEAIVNNDELVVVWASKDGQNQKAAEDAPILYLVFTAPDAAGEYPVTFKNLEAVNRDGSEITIEQTPGAVIVLDETTTTAEVTEAETTTTTEAKADETTTTAEPAADETTTAAATTTADEPVDTTTTTPMVIPAGEVGWIIGTETVAKGATAKVPVNVKSDPGTAGFVVEFDADPALTFTGFEWGTGYTGEAIVNNDELVVVWASKEGTNQTAADDAPILYLIFTAPDAVGEYPVTFKNLEVSNTDGSFAETIEQPGAVIVIDDVITTTTAETPDEKTTTTEPVVEPGTTTTAEQPEPDETTTTAAPQEGTTTTAAPQEGTTTTAAPQEGTTTAAPQEGTTTAAPQEGTTTTSEVAPPKPGNVVYKIGDVTGQAGTTVKVPVYVYYDEGTAGLTMEFDVPDGCKISGIEYGDAYSNDNNAFTWSAEEHVLIWSSPDGQNQTAAAGATLVTLLVDVPADAKEGDVFPITFVKGSVEVSDTDRNLLEHTEIDGSVTISKPEPTGDVVFNIGSASGQPGEVVDVPLTVSLDKGTTSFTLTLDVPDGTTIEDLKIDPNSPYAQNGVFTWDPETKTLTWTSNDGKPVDVEPGTKIADISVKIPEDAEPGTEIPIKVSNATATDEAGKTMIPTVVPGKVTVTDKDVTTTTAEPIEEGTTTASATEPEVGTTTTAAEPETTTTTAAPQEGTTTTEAPQEGTTTTTAEPEQVTTTTTEALPATVNTITSIATTFEPPTRVNYWSHDPRSFEESGGLKGLSASIVLTKYYVNDQNQFCDAEGNVIEGAPAYDPTTGAIPEGVTAAETKTLDATAYTHPLEMEDGPKKVWDNETAASLGKTDYTPEEELTAKHANKYPMKAYFHPSEQTDPDFAAINGGEPLYMGDFNIFIGVKGDCTLDNHVKVDDAQYTLVYYTETLVAHQKEAYLVDDPEMGDVDQLRYYLADVDWAEKDESGANYLVDADNHPVVKQPTRLDAADAQYILVHYTNNYVSYIPMTWTDVVGYDLYDSFFGGVTEGEN